MYNVFSEFRSVTCGVPQGSILGPLLFLIYVNDMKAAVKCKLLLYADDSALLASSSDVSEIEDVLSRELESVSEWLVENRLSLHLGKTESILFGSNKRLAKRRELHITCNGNDIESGAKVTYLGVTLDQNLSGARQSLLSLHMTKSYVRTATRSTLKVEANLTQILNFKANFHTEFEPFFKKKIYANNGGHFKIVSIKIKN